MFLCESVHIKQRKPIFEMSEENDWTFKKRQLNI